MMFGDLSLAYYDAGLQLARGNELGAAVQNLSRSVRYDITNSTAWNLLGLCHYRLGEYRRAEYCWQQSVQRCPTGPTQNLAVQYLADLQSNHSQTKPYFSEVDDLCRQKRYGQAAATLSINICPRFDQSVALLNYLGILHILDGKPGQAAECWKTVLSMDKDNVDAIRYLDESRARFRYRLLALGEKLPGRYSER